MVTAKGPITRLDPRGRVLVALIFAVVVVSLHSLWVLCLALAVAVLLVPMARLPLGTTVRRVLAVDGFIVILLLSLPFTTPGTPIAEVWGLTASREGLEDALRIALKANATMFALLTLVGTLDEPVLGHALHSLRVPAKLVTLFLMTVRYIEVLGQEYQRLRVAMKARGFRPRTNMHTLRSLGYLVGMLLVRALERSERVLAAMKCRGFNGSFPLTSEFRARPRDAVFGTMMGGVMVGLIGLDRTGGLSWLLP